MTHIFVNKAILSG